MATHFSILAWRFSWTEEPGGLCVCVCVCVYVCVCIKVSVPLLDLIPYLLFKILLLSN